MPSHAAPLIEPVFVPDVMVSGIAAVRPLGDSLRVSFYVERGAIGAQPAERAIVCHLIMQQAVLEAFCPGAWQLFAAAAEGLPM